MPPPPSPAPIPRLPHLEDPHILATRCGQLAHPDPKSVGLGDIFIFRDVLEELCYRALYTPDAGSFMALTGGWFVGPFGPYIEIDSFRDAVYASSTLSLLTFLTQHRELWPQPTQPKQTTTPKPDSGPGFGSAAEPNTKPLHLGNCLVLPGCGARLGPDEVLLFNSFLNAPYHTLLLIDPTTEQLGFYARDAQRNFYNLPFWLLD